MMWLADAETKRVDKLSTARHRSNVRLAWLVTGLTLAFTTGARAQAPQDEIVYVDTDGIGSVRLLTDAGGNILERHDFQPFGQETPPATSGGNPLFAGKERDASGTDYSGARYFAAKLGRFVMVDPVTGKPDDPQSWNRFAYARNNPLRFIDPDGREYDACAMLDGDGNNWGLGTMADCFAQEFDPFLWPDSALGYAIETIFGGGYHSGGGSTGPFSADNESYAGVDPVKIVNRTSVDPADAQRFEAGHADALNRVDTIESCNAFYDGKGHDALVNTKYYFVKYESGSAAYTPQGATDQVNINYSDFSGNFLRPPAIYGGAGGRALNIVTYPSAVILHELGHELDVYTKHGGYQQDGSDLNKSNANSRLVLNACFP